MGISNYFYKRETIMSDEPDDTGDYAYVDKFFVYRAVVVGQHYLKDDEGYSTPQYTCQISLVTALGSVAECEAFIAGVRESSVDGAADFDKPYSCTSVSSMGAPGKYPLNAAISEEPLFEVKESEVINIGKY